MEAERKKDTFSALLLLKYVSITGHIEEHEEELEAERQAKAKTKWQRSDFQTCFYKSMFLLQVISKSMRRS